MTRRSHRLPRPARHRSGFSTMIAGGAIIAALVIVAITALIWTPYGPMKTNTGMPYSAPSADHWFGTDRLGSDILSRVMYGAVTDVGITIAAVALAFVVGTLVGAISGFVGGRLDAVVMRLLEIVQAFPALLLAILMVAAVGSGLVNVIIVVAILGVPNYLRMIRAEVLSRKQWQLTEAAYLAGNRGMGVLFKHIVPNSLLGLLAFAPVNASWVAVTTASLGFIGLGIEPGAAEWGAMISLGQQSILSGEWWISFFPGAAIVLLAAGFYLIGDGANAALSTNRSKMRAT